MTYGNQTHYSLAASVKSVSALGNAKRRLIATIGMDYKDNWASATSYPAGVAAAVVLISDPSGTSLKRLRAGWPTERHHG